MDGSVDHINGLNCPMGVTLSLFVKEGESSATGPVPIFSSGDPNDNLIYGVSLLSNTTSTNSEVTYTFIIAQKGQVMRTTVTQAKKVWTHYAVTWHELVFPELFINGKSMTEFGLDSEILSITDYNPSLGLIADVVNTTARLGCQAATPGMASQIYVDDVRFAQNIIQKVNMEYIYTSKS